MCDRMIGCHGWSGWIKLNQPLFSSCASSGMWSLLWQDMFLHSQGLVFLKEQRGRAAKTVFGLKYFSGFALKYLHGKMLFHVVSVLYVIEVVDWGLRLILPLSLFDCFYDTFILILVLFLSRALAWLTSSTIERLARNASWHQRQLQVEWKEFLSEDFLRNTFWHCEFCGNKLLLD